MRIDQIYDIYYLEQVNKYVVYARVKVSGTYRYERLFFDTEIEVRNIKEGDIINANTQK